MAASDPHFEARQTRNFAAVDAHKVRMFVRMCPTFNPAFELKAPHMVAKIGAGYDAHFRQIDEVAINSCPIKALASQGFEQLAVAVGAGSMMQKVEHRDAWGRTSKPSAAQ